MSKRILVIAPHPDDEVLGVGGTIARFVAEGNNVYVLIATQGQPPLFQEEFIAQGRQEALTAHQLLGVKETRFLSLPAAYLDTVPQVEVNTAIGEVITALQPEHVFVPFVGDIHRDHQQIFMSTLVACRPNTAPFPKIIYAYETLSETNWNAPYLTANFVPNVFIDISAFLHTKIAAMELYASQVKTAPHERSIEAVIALATLRGSTVGCHAAEAFVLVRQVV